MPYGKTGFFRKKPGDSHQPWYENRERLSFWAQVLKVSPVLY
jgi:hypothetical protein